KVKSGVKDTFSATRKQLTAMGCKEADGTAETDEYCSATFRKQGFNLAVMVFGGQHGESMVTINNLGNIEPAQLPHPKTATAQFTSTAMAMYQIDAPQEQVAKNIADQMAKAKWEPYGTAGDQMFFRRNAVIASINCMVAPGEDGKSILQYSTVLASAEIPLPATAEAAQYADVTQELSFNSKDDVSQISQFYVNALAASGWKPTSDSPVPIDFELIQIFSQEETGQLMRLMIREVKDEGLRRVRMKLWHREDEKE
ncbi:MAG: hypothetical protein KDA85_04575, partial [Planctomycetaceae bacterium]|nr:hypothetical protein [Planctomycetaceae bacterium]